MKYALIGCGRVSPNHILAAQENGLTVCALCDLNLAQAQENLQEFYGAGKEMPPFYTDYHEMLAMEQPDLVAIATYSGTHAAIALDCIAAGCHVIIEKPIALSMDDARAIVTAAKEKGVLVSTNMQNRFNAPILLLKEALDAGRLGTLISGSMHVRWHRDEAYYSQAAWRGTWAQDGGALMNQSIHGLDLLRWLMGNTITSVSGTVMNRMHPYIEAEDIGTAVLTFANGALATVECTTCAFGAQEEETLELLGTKGLVKLGGTCAQTVEMWRFADGDEAEEQDMIHRYGKNPASVYGHGHTALYADMLHAISDGCQPFVSGEAGVQALETVLAIYQSTLVGGKVTLPLDHCSTLDFQNMLSK